MGLDVDLGQELGLGQICAQELEVDTRNKEEEVFIVTSSADLIPAYLDGCLSTDEGIPNPCLSSVGPGMQVHREAATQPRANRESMPDPWEWGWDRRVQGSRLLGTCPGVWPLQYLS